MGNYQPPTFYITASLRGAPALAWSIRVVHSEITATFLLLGNVALAFEAFQKGLHSQESRESCSAAQKLEGKQQMLMGWRETANNSSLPTRGFIVLTLASNRSSSSLMGKVNSPHTSSLGSFHKSSFWIIAKETKTFQTQTRGDPTWY